MEDKPAKIDVVGVLSGDNECWCLLVTKEDFLRIMDHNEVDDFMIGPFAKKDSPYKYMVYPSDLIKHDKDKPVRLQITVTPLPPCDGEHGVHSCESSE